MTELGLAPSDGMYNNCAALPFTGVLGDEPYETLRNSAKHAVGAVHMQAGRVERTQDQELNTAGAHPHQPHGREHRGRW